MESLNFVEKKVIRVGAEAVIKEAFWKNHRIIVKHRVPKRYREESIDLRVRKSRTIHEAKMLIHLSENGIPVPLVYFIDPVECVIYMQYIEGLELRNHPGAVERAKRLGNIVGEMHGLDVCHGDLTLANIIADENQGVWVVDFGLSGFNADLEEKAIDVHLLERSAASTFPTQTKKFFENFLKSYSETTGRDAAKEVLEKVKEIRSRGRYVAR
ncbi:MAG: KEOPS complex kinase/ATPase Bud32 [Candidatus Caldarchaeum sp.]|nr:KEOPS complex kinase/ATPase Bud32 [Candidatus Caldarchaeum sp.]MCS7133432.1 KEOPS complex kinase/ATPase Bud32 [Candidatus Caldarchaeum sp.]MCX8201760.1 KEOPS complex kinase/ATPase Bud32 [Candidatus Caldarchaeum sp.]MDW8062787.1 KEOPS complex kinase/ATPase Bud32 [Candidatus Caldarchaeum sp.]MDW8435039.1 KEOPS complex kinase/ATPase Bud32 [Candidatus Caldarchaeum sp.]